MLPIIYQMQLFQSHTRYSQSSESCWSRAHRFCPPGLRRADTSPPNTLVCIAAGSSCPTPTPASSTAQLPANPPPLLCRSSLTSSCSSRFHLPSLSLLFDHSQAALLWSWQTQSRHDGKTTWRLFREDSRARHSSQFKGIPVSACSPHCWIHKKTLLWEGKVRRENSLVRSSATSALIRDVFI